MSSVIIAFLGIPYSTALLITTIVATIVTTLAMCTIVFLAWAPHVSTEWAAQFGVGATDVRDNETASRAD